MVLLLLAGTEVFVLAPYIFDIAVMIDVGGLVFVLAAVQASVSASAMQLRGVLTVITKPLFAASTLVEKIVDFGSGLPPKWCQRGLSGGLATARYCSAGLMIVYLGLVVTKAFIATR
jgi:hypothetical protein